MPIDEAFGVFILGCSPGGVISNLAVYWLGGILELRYRKFGFNCVFLLIEILTCILLAKLAAFLRLPTA